MESGCCPRGCVWTCLASLLFTLCVAPTAALPPLPEKYSREEITIAPVTLSPPVTPRPECRDPEECCLHPYDSEKFDLCCEEHGCCPLTCPVTKPGGEIIPTRHCQAWECCVHREGSDKHQKCCKRHGCCPVCERVPSGCCYNDLRYEFGTVVQDLSEACVQLVCAAKLLPTWPYFVATITAVKICSFKGMSEVCTSCPVHHCVDKMGLVRMEGEMWSPTPCTKCECRQGHVLCIGLFGGCETRPHAGCIALPGPCCPTYHCPDGCIDEAGIFRPVGTQWPSSDPCRTLECTEDGINPMDILCDFLPPPHEGCYTQHVPGQCCPEWNCSRCLDNDGTFHALDEEWQASPCFVKVCTSLGVVIKEVTCPTLSPAPHPTCYRDVKAGGCCEEWKCDGCWDDDVLHPPGSQWPSGDICFNKECTNNGIVLRRIDCPVFPRPHQSCFEYIPDGECCPAWNCSGCLTEKGEYHPLYHEWQTDPCTTFVCHLDGITHKDACSPLGPAPHKTCYTGLGVGGCCQEWKCDGCIVDGVFYPVGTEIPSSDPCETVVCVAPDVLHTATIDCKYEPPPHHSCVLQHIEGQCCPEWNCSGCLDVNGKFRKLLEKWKSDACTTNFCTRGGILTTKEDCFTTPRPHNTCDLVLLPDECCPTWNCSGCLEESEEGPVFHPLGEEWKVNQCHIKTCFEDGIFEIFVDCPPDVPPRPGCRRWTDPDMCCPQWNCTDCVDEDGNLWPNGTKWTSEEDPCITLECVDSVIESSPVYCSDSEPPLPNCFPTVLEGQCCPTWNCSGCIDEAGDFHHLGSTWTYFCKSYNCTSEGISVDDVQCLPQPHPGCVRQLPPADGCCPSWRCDEPDCSEEQCQGPPWNAKCRAHTPPDKCCPVYLCGPPQSDPDKPRCAEVYCRGPPLYQNCTCYWHGDECCPRISCSPPVTPHVRPDCAAVLCMLPPQNVSCNVTTPPGQCCPILDCNNY